ncbi:hypothetical protein PHPALM_28591 [Phytophthora palmivora]|uniref:Uncharacterized protein n=1 Tax=Phytophthora palmivora TaxID=4796 RepID=A0A2P4X9P8_9STRA|nr:hypothetical protein PHPALM_28591 [Phytophthora palmivora]
MVVLHIAQLLKAAQQLESSIDCMLACLYEQLGLPQAARFWWKKLSNLSSSNGLNAQLWEAMADRLFDRDLYVFAVDFYAKVMSIEDEKILPSNRFRYRYLVSLLAFIGPYGPTMHMNLHVPCRIRVDGWPCWSNSAMVETSVG